MLNVETEDPTSAARLLGIGPLRAIKHHALIENQAAVDANRKIVLFSGDWDDGWPTNQRSDYPPNGYWSSDGRQEMWYADVSSTALGAGKVRFKLAQNFYHNYPWNGSVGFSGQGGFGGVEPQRGPFMPDALGFVCDKRGDFWAGPCTVGYNQVSGDAAGESFRFWSPVYKWNMPGLHSNGVRLGNGWTRPNQNRLKQPMAGSSGGQPGVDWDVGIYSDSEMNGWGRPNTTAYDPVTDKLYVVGMFSSTTDVTVVLYSMSLDPAVVSAQGGQYRWVREQLTPISLASLGMSNATAAADWLGDVKNANVSNICVANGSLYFTFLNTYSVPSGQGNATSTLKRISWILSVNLSTKAVGRVPYPSTMNWWLRLYDGPQSGAAQSSSVTPLTAAQYRSMKAVGNKIVLGPDYNHNITQDPWICVFDTVSKTWSTFDPPASYALTSGGQDWPMSIFNLVAMPSLGEVWLAGHRAPGGTTGDALDQLIVANGLHRPETYQDTTGVWLGRRIIRFKV